jgi:hypothetical protein
MFVIERPAHTETPFAHEMAKHLPFVAWVDLVPLMHQERFPCRAPVYLVHHESTLQLYRKMGILKPNADGSGIAQRAVCACSGHFHQE